MIWSMLLPVIIAFSGRGKKICPYVAICRQDYKFIRSFDVVYEVTVVFLGLVEGGGRVYNVACTVLIFFGCGIAEAAWKFAAVLCKMLIQEFLAAEMILNVSFSGGSCSFCSRCSSCTRCGGFRRELLISFEGFLAACRGVGVVSEYK